MEKQYLLNLLNNYIYTKKNRNIERYITTALVNKKKIIKKMCERQKNNNKTKI